MLYTFAIICTVETLGSSSEILTWAQKGFLSRQHSSVHLQSALAQEFGLLLSYSSIRDAKLYSTLRIIMLQIYIYTCGVSQTKWLSLINASSSTMLLNQLIM